MLTGDLSLWLPHFRSLEERLLEAIEAAWPICVGPLQYKKDSLTHEDHITEHLVYALIRTKKAPGRIVYQYPLLGADEAENVSVPSNIDFVLTVGDDEHVYLACECKRLNVPYETGVKSLGGEYVDEGLMRFVAGKYSNGLPLAMMLGYVMDAKAPQARARVKKAMKVRIETIQMISEKDNPISSGKPLRFFTAHKCHAGNAIEIAHTLLDWP